jgi:hypothetical protein
MGVVALAAGVGVWLPDRAPPPRPLVRFTLEFPPGQQVADAVGGTTIAVSPDGLHLAYLGRGPEGNQLFLRSMDRVEAIPIPHTHGAHLPFFSPDGGWLGFVIGNAIRKVALPGGPALTVCQLVTNMPGASWGTGRRDHIRDARRALARAGEWRRPATGCRLGHGAWRAVSLARGAAER